MWYAQIPPPCYKPEYQEVALLRHELWVHGPTIFLEKETLVSLGGFDEKYKWLEDYPIGMKFVANNFFIIPIHEPLVKHRVRDNSVSHSNSNFMDCLMLAIQDYSRPAALRHGLYLIWWHETVCKFLREHKLPSPCRSIIARLSPLYWKYNKRHTN